MAGILVATSGAERVLKTLKIKRQAEVMDLLDLRYIENLEGPRNMTSITGYMWRSVYYTSRRCLLYC